MARKTVSPSKNRFPPHHGGETATKQHNFLPKKSSLPPIKAGVPPPKMGGKLLGLRDCDQDGGETSEFPPHDGGEIIEKTSILGACGAFRSKLTFFDDSPPPWWRGNYRKAPQAAKNDVFGYSTVGRKFSGLRNCHQRWGETDEFPPPILGGEIKNFFFCSLKPKNDVFFR